MKLSTIEIILQPTDRYHLNDIRIKLSVTQMFICKTGQEYLHQFIYLTDKMFLFHFSQRDLQESERR